MRLGFLALFAAACTAPVNGPPMDLSGGATDLTLTVGDDDLLKLERQAFMTLVRHPATLARIEHMLETGKPLRN